MAWRTQTYGTTVDLTTSQEPGCVHPRKNLVSNNFILCISIRQLYMIMSFSQAQSDSYGFQILKYSSFLEWLQAVQVLMVLSVVFSSVSFLVFLGQLFTMSKGGLFYFTGLCQVFAGNSGVKQCVTNMTLCDETI